MTTEDESNAPGLLKTDGIDAVYILHDTTTVDIAKRLFAETEKILRGAQK